MGSKSPLASSQAKEPSVNAMKSRSRGLFAHHIVTSSFTQWLRAAGGDAKSTKLLDPMSALRITPPRSAAAARFVWSRKTRGGHHSRHL